MKTNRFLIFSMLGIWVAFALLHFQLVTTMQVLTILCIYFSVMGYNLARDNDKHVFAVAWSVLFCAGIDILAMIFVSAYIGIYSLFSLAFILINFSESSEFIKDKKDIKDITGKDIQPEIQQVKMPDYKVKDVIKAKNKLLLIEIDSKKMTVEIVVPQNLGYFFATIDNLMNEKQDFDNFIQWVKFVNNNCYAAYCLIQNDNDRIDTLECLQRIMSVTTPLLNKYGGDCFIETK